MPSCSSHKAAQPAATHLRCCRCLRAAPGLRQALTSEATGATYTLNTLKLGFADAEAQCNELGGHVVCYGGIAEQVEVELYYVTRVREGGGRGAGAEVVLSGRAGRILAGLGVQG